MAASYKSKFFYVSSLYYTLSMKVRGYIKRVTLLTFAWKIWAFGYMCKYAAETTILISNRRLSLILALYSRSPCLNQMYSYIQEFLVWVKCNICLSLRALSCVLLESQNEKMVWTIWCQKIKDICFPHTLLWASIVVHQKGMPIRLKSKC